MPAKKYAETAFYEFDTCYAKAVDLQRRVFGDERADALQAAKGKSTRTDFMNAILWGWFFHRTEALDAQARALAIMGNLIPKSQEKALRDYAQWGLAAGLHREKVREAIFTLSIYGGIPTTEWALGIVDNLCSELDAKGWQPMVPSGSLFEGVEHNYYDFEANHLDGFEARARRLGDEGGTTEERLARTGASAIGDFGSITWGWMMHRPIVSPRERYFFLLGADSANKGYLALKDHTHWALTHGVTRAEVQEGLMMLNLFSGWPANREAGTAVTQLFAELDKKAAGEQPAAAGNRAGG